MRIANLHVSILGNLIARLSAKLIVRNADAQHAASSCATMAGSMFGACLRAVQGPWHDTAKAVGGKHRLFVLPTVDGRGCYLLAGYSVAHRGPDRCETTRRSTVG